jgi:hypothetical protein|tara:strand:+ start:734 stop:2899 length:2166 start_codon:yes stop_codon:yes gene_type:complete
MAYLQRRHNLADIENICEAQNVLGLRDMAYQCSADLQITGGNITATSITTSNLKIFGGNPESNYFLKTDGFGNASWSMLTPYDSNLILLSSFSNDLGFQTASNVSNMIDLRLLDYTSNLQILDLDLLTTSNITLTGHGSGVLTTNVDGIISISDIINSYSNSSRSNLVSCQALSNLYTYMTNLTSSGVNIPNSDMLSKALNLEDIPNTVSAVSNLGLNVRLETNEIRVNNLYASNLDASDLILSNLGEAVLGGTMRLVVTDPETNKLFKSSNITVRNRVQDSVSLQLPEEIFLISEWALIQKFSNVVSNIDTRLMTNNVLSEYFDSDENSLILYDKLSNLLKLHEVSRTGDYSNLDNRPQDMSYFTNEPGYIQNTCNLGDLTNTSNARSNLELHTVANTGDFYDLDNTQTFSNLCRLIDDNDGYNPFLLINSNLSELSCFASQARSNLGIGDLATLSRSNVSILGGTATLTELTIRSNVTLSNCMISYGIEDFDFILTATSNQNDDESLVSLLRKPIATASNFGFCKIISTESDLLTFDTHDTFDNESSNTTLSVNVIKNLVETAVNLVPRATPSSDGTVTVKSVYEHNSQADESSVVLNMQGARSLTYYMSNDTRDQIIAATELSLTQTIEAENLTVKNQIIYMPSTGPTNRLDAVASNMFFTVVEENGLMGYSQIWGVGSNTGNPGDEVELKVGKTWEMICDSNVFKLSKGGVVKHIFS